MSDRLAVRKTYKLFIGGAFPRSESGRSYPVQGVNVAQGSRKDIRDAVVAARAAFAGWSGTTAYNRGQVLYRVAEMLEGRRAEFPAGEIDDAIDRLVWYAGWADKYAQVMGGTNPVAGPYFNFSIPEPMGVVGIIAPPESALLGLVSVLAPVIATGNVTVVIAAEDQPLAAVVLCEVLATADLPGGVINIVTGRLAELAPWLAGHRDVNAIDLTGVPAADRGVLVQAAAGNVKRVHAPREQDWCADPGLTRLIAFIEIKTVWHPIGV